MRLNVTGDPVLGLWEAAEHRIVFRRDQLSSLAAFAATFLREVGHMAGGTADRTIAFEDELSRLLGLAAAAALRGRNGWTESLRRTWAIRGSGSLLGAGDPRRQGVACGHERTAGRRGARRGRRGA